LNLICYFQRLVVKNLQLFPVPEKTMTRRMTLLAVAPRRASLLAVTPQQKDIPARGMPFNLHRD
jgi:hypothetical protein